MREASGSFKWRRTTSVSLSMAVWSIVSFAADSPAATVDDVIRQEVMENDTSKAIQKRIDAIADDIDAMSAEYRAALQNQRELEVYNRQLEELIRSQREEMESLRRQIDNVTVVGRQVMPLIERMIDTLDGFVELDVPFLVDERRERIAGLREMMLRADVTISEKYRRTLEAYQIENEYGRTIEAYRDGLPMADSSRTVDFLRVGRNALLYQTLDGQESGVWDPYARSWRKLDDSYRIAIRQGLRMARKQVAPDLIEVPMPAPEPLR